MAAARGGTVSDEQNPTESRALDPALDFFSEHFDPLKALTTPGVVPPVTNATTYDNLALYKSAHSDEGKQVAKAGSSKSIAPIEKPERKWLPHQLPIRVERTYNPRNVLTKMETMTGPLGLLKKCKDERIRIKVWTRHSHDIRGYCTAFVTVFDKHWNLVLEDVTEVWTRPKRRKVPAGLGNADGAISISRGRLVPPPVTIVKSDKKTETCQRHVGQLLVRGEHIAIIVVLPLTSNEETPR